QQEQLKPFYFRSGETITPLKGTGYRLPTEAEWESACRAGTTTRFWSGEEDKSLMQVGWFMRNSGKRTHATGELKANPFGLFDVHGNVWEWVQDNWDPAYYGKFEENAAVDPCSPFLADSQQVIRGGYWFNYPSHCRSSCRLADPPTYRNYVIGFRIALPVDAVKQSLQRNLIESSPVELFNGQELTGWKMHPDAPGNWHVENGELISDGKPSYLFSERNDYDNFELTCEVSISDGGDSGLIVRSPFEKVGPNGLPGYEAQIQAGKVLTAGWATGAIAQSGTSTGWSLKQYSSISVPPNEYFTLKVRAAHNRVKTYVNGVQVAEYVDPAWTYQRGHIALQHSGANTVIKFRKITVTELVPEQSTTTPANFALQFDGIDDFVSIPVQLGMVGRYVPDRPFTYEAFFTPHQQRPEVEQGVLKKEALPPPLVPGVLGFFRIGALTYQPGKHLLDWVESTQIFSDAPIVKNQEHHVAMVWDGQVMQMYVDGVKQNLGRAVIPPLDSAVQSEFDNAPFSLCGMQTQNGFVNTFAGTIREVRISTTARYTDDFIPEQRLTTDASTIGLYHCDDGAGNTLADASGNNRHGTIHGANWVRTDRVPAVRPTSEFALQFDGVDDCVEWSELSVPLDRPVRIELAATVDSIQTNAETGIPIFNWGGAVAVSAAADPNIGDVLTVRFLSNPGVHHTWHIRNAVEAGRRFSLVVDYRDGVANFSVNGRPVPASQLRYVLQRDGESDFDARPETFRLFSDMKRSFLATPSTHPDQKSIALHGKVHHLKLTQDTGDTIAEFDFTQGSGDVLNDSSGNGHDGKIVGATWVKADDSAIVAQEQFDWSTIWPADAPAPAIAPFTTDEAKAHQEAWAKYLGVPVEYENSIGMKFRLIPPGEFMMGSTPEEIAAAGAGEPALGKQLIEAEGPQHRVVLTQPFYLAATELTQAEFEEILGRNPSQFSPNGARKAAVDGMETAKFPVDRLSWHEAAEFCIALSEREKMKPSYFRNGAVVTSLGNDGYHMPTEAEWEFACRAGTTSLYSSGDSVGDAQRVAWLRPNSGARTHAVGELPPNAFGLFDVHGNVWEWTEDGYDPLSYSKGTERPFVAPRVELGPEHLRVIRGGNFNCADPLARSAHRRGSVGHWSGDGLGVRISLPFAAVKAAIERPDTPETPISEYQWPTDAPAPAIAPFTADEAKAHQEAWAKYLGVPVEYENSIGMKFRLIPPGEFMMGSTLEEIAAALSVVGEDKTWQEEVNSEGPQHRVVLTQPIYVGVTEVTQSQYENVVGTTPSHFSATGDGREAVANLDTNDHPVERVTWNDAAEFCANLSQQSRLKPFYFRSGPSVTLLAGNGYRLPTEAEWEFSCRAGTMTRFWCGTDDSDLLAAAWFRANAGSRTHPVGELKLNPFGLADVYGNVWEWTQDSWSTKSYNQLDATSLIDPLNLTDTSPQHVIRGGYFWDVPSYCRSSNRRTTPPGAQYNNQGFRVVLPVDAVRQLSSEEANR
ncbi:MAG: SUMF1/EgtB/PvdO family nonheme iron enzyme, partial [Planctomycetaceae bacterium]|nr:SUMF1/EgtB/PvdO family nonheme iron enzyme [Planctomycetaceae bacterium]